MRLPKTDARAAVSGCIGRRHLAVGSRVTLRHAVQLGFTLVELMTVLAVLVVLLAIAVPSLGSFISSSRVNALQSELVSSLVLARSEATRRGVPVGVVASDTLIDSRAEFSGGWKVWVDSNADGVFDATEFVVRDYPAVVGGTSVASGGVTQVRFGPNGFLMPAAAVVFNVCGRAEPGGSAKGFQVRLEPVGLADVHEVRPCQ